ncbi:hypothetical protein [Saccharopolyspora taberi]|uniref:Uncharacterized protein n=1 Tax=Saccharopolyspora taberi TaxID=60895 RepID=A0ABN3V9L1_9PSEU
MSRAGATSMPVEHSWSREEAGVLERATEAAPSADGSRPCELQLVDRMAMLCELRGADLVRCDAEARDRIIFCGAVLANLVLAIRSLGWATVVQRDSRPDVVAAVIGAHRVERTPEEIVRHEAIGRRRCWRQPFLSAPLSPGIRDALRDAATSSAVHARWVAGEQEALALARLLRCTGLDHGDENGYRNELAMWTPGPRPGASAEPDLTGSICEESVLVLGTPSDDRRNRLRAGESMQTAWLEATTRGLVASVMTRPLHRTEVRTALRQRLDLPCEPQVVMRFGHPVPDPRSG